MIRDVERARAALGSECEISQGDIRSVEFGATDAVVILDVLHYICQEEQLQVLKRVRAALPARGLLLLRPAACAFATVNGSTSWSCCSAVMQRWPHIVEARNSGASCYVNAASRYRQRR